MSPLTFAQKQLDVSSLCGNSARLFAVAYRKDLSHAKQFFPDDKKNHKISSCADTTQGNDRFPLFPQAPYFLAKG
jgi:hypothetical protein